MANTGSGNVKNLCPLKKAKKRKQKYFVENERQQVGF